MKLASKGIAVVAVIWALWAAFVCTIGLLANSQPLLAGVLALATVSAVFVAACFNHIVLQPLKQISHQLKEINQTNSLTKRLDTSGQDEIAQVAMSINQILESIQQSQEKQEERFNQDMKSIQETNLELKSEIAQLKPIASKPVVKAEYPSWLTRDTNMEELPNRIYFNGVLSKSIEQAHRHHHLLAVLLVDISVPPAEEKNAATILQHVSGRLVKTLRSEDFLAKLDGNQFIILINKIDKPQFASIVAEKLLKSLSQPIVLSDHEYSPATSIGICTYPNDGLTLNELLTNVDTAVYKANARGSNNYQFYSQEAHTSAKEYIEMEKALHNAIINNELVLYFQPKLNVKKGSITGVEALLRWVNPNFGIMYPMQFLSVADETGFFLPMAEWVIREACKINKAWQEEGYGHIIMSVNLTAKQFQHPEIPNIISRALEDFKLNAKYLEIEVDENSVMEDVSASTNTLMAVKSTGVRISVDHFGTGYTCISYLKKFPISTIKIDRSFIKGIPANPNDSAIASSFIALAHQLGIEVVAEGVETAEQVQFLSEKQCDLVQGYFLSHPLPADKLKAKLSKISEEVLI